MNCFLSKRADRSVFGIAPSLIFSPLITKKNVHLPCRSSRSEPSHSYPLQAERQTFDKNVGADRTTGTGGGHSGSAGPSVRAAELFVGTRDKRRRQEEGLNKEREKSGQAAVFSVKALRRLVYRRHKLRLNFTCG